MVKDERLSGNGAQPPKGTMQDPTTRRGLSCISGRPRADAANRRLREGGGRNASLLLLRLVGQADVDALALAASDQR